MKVPLGVPYREQKRGPLDGHLRWRKSLPFVASKTGQLIHRVRFAHTILWDGVRHHDSANTWCGTQFCSPLFLDEPPEGRLLCARCEAVAVSKGLRTAETFLGRHVCTGYLKAHRLCCKNEGN